MLTGKYYTGFLSVCQIHCWIPGVPRVSGAKRGILSLFGDMLAKFIFMVPVTFSGFWYGYSSGWGEVREGVAHKKISIGHEKEGRGTTIGSPPLPYEIRACVF